VPHERIELIKNADFWDTARMPKIDRMVLLPMPEATTRAAALLSGQVDWVEAPSPDTIPALEGAGMQIVTNRYPHTWPYLLNMQKGPFTDVRVRQAANYAVDRDAMTAMLGGIAEPAIGIYIPSQAAYGTPFPYTHDIEKAKALLQEAGCYPCEIRVAISTAGSGQMQPLPMNELVKANLEEAGFKVVFEVEDWNTMITQFLKGAVDYPELDAINFSSGAADPLSFVKTFLTRYTTPKGSNWGGYSNPEVDKMLEEVLVTFDPAKQTEILTEVHAIVTGDAARLPIVSDLNPRALAPYVKGFVQAQSWFQDMTPVYVER
jgi:ABC-type transport system substrate-binding protein